MARHQDKEVEAAIIRLSDALCSFERSTGIESVLIIRQQDGFVCRRINGKPGIPDTMTDADVCEFVTQ